MEQDTGSKKQFYFEERQRFTNWIAWTLTLGTLGLMIAILSYQIFTGNEVGNKPAPNIILAGFILIYYVPVILLMFYARLAIRINEDGIYYGWNLPTKELNKIDWADVQSCEITKYKFVGFGYKLTKKYGTVYNTKGNKGLLITKKSGEKILLGSLKTNELADVLTRMSLPNN